jgi:hypothetical protein
MVSTAVLGQLETASLIRTLTERTTATLRFKKAEVKIARSRHLIQYRQCFSCRMDWPDPAQELSPDYDHLRSIWGSVPAA